VRHWPNLILVGYKLLPSYRIVRIGDLHFRCSDNSALSALATRVTEPGLQRTLVLRRRILETVEYIVALFPEFRDRFP
jgi:hypothetical protein